jgi:hypothetical protein
MPEITRCQSCGRALRLPDDLMGQLVQCPGCGKTFVAGAGRPSAPPPAAPAASADPLPFVPLPGERPAPPPRPRRKRLERDYDDDWDEDDWDGPEYDRPRRKGRRAAEAAVLAPSIALMVTGLLGVFYYVISGVVFFAAAYDVPGFVPWRTAPVERTPAVLVVGSVVTLFIIAWWVVVIIAAFQMKNLRGYAFAVTGSVMAMIPCNLACLLGLPFGIWALVVLYRPNVMSAFR